jgi:hypothetical protein
MIWAQLFLAYFKAFITSELEQVQYELKTLIGIIFTLGTIHAIHILLSLFAAIILATAVQ